MIDMTMVAAGPPMWATVAVAGAAAIVPPLVWLTGLTLALRKSAPTERPDILRAYATLRLPFVRAGSIKDRDGPGTGSAGENPVSSTHNGERAE